MLALAGEQGAQRGELARAARGRDALLGEMGDVAPERLGPNLIRRPPARGSPVRELLHVHCVAAPRALRGIATAKIAEQQLQRLAPWLWQRGGGAMPDGAGSPAGARGRCLKGMLGL